MLARKLTSALLAASTLFCLCACDEKTHKHEYLWHLVTPPTCTSEGTMEGICDGCGKKTYTVVVPNAHLYNNGVCVVCDGVENEENTFKPQTTPDGWSMLDIFSTGILPMEAVFEEYLNGVIEFSDLHVTKIGTLEGETNTNTVPYGEENFSFVLPDLRGEYTVAGKAQEIAKIILDCYDLTVVFKDGTQVEYGEFVHLDGSTKSDTAENKVIQSFIFNKKNEAYLVYRNGLVKKVGKIPNHDTESDENVLIYQRHSNEYSVCGFLDEHIKNVAIPATHRGLPVTKIAPYAFQYAQELVSVSLPASLKSVGHYAFGGCESLNTIILNEGLENIDFAAFYDTALTSVVLPESLRTISSLAFPKEITVYAQIPTPPSGWSAWLNQHGGKIYYKGEW